MCAQETQKTEENERGVDLNINIYYGGRGIIDDPTIYVINKMQEVLEELRVHVERYNLYDGKTNITTLPQTLKEADGIILATTVEWYGIGGYMQQFLDACWLYGDKETIGNLYVSGRDVYHLRRERRQAQSCGGLGDSGRIALQRHMRIYREYSNVGDERTVRPDH